MLSAILTSFRNNPSLGQVTDVLAGGGNAAVHGLGGSSAAFLAAVLLTNENGSCGRSVLAVLPEEEDAEVFRGDFEDILGPGRVQYFPERDVNPYEPIDSHPEVRSQRVETLDLLERGWHGIVVASIGALHDPTTPSGLTGLVSFSVGRGERIAFDDFIRLLVGKGFKRRNTVSSAGQIAVRGGIVDVFPYGGDVPYRVEFWGDEVESIRAFSITSQRSIEPVEEFRVIPPDEFVTEAGMNPADEERIRNIEIHDGIDLSRIRRAFEGKDRPNGLEQYLHVVFGAGASLPSHLSERDVVVIFDPDVCREQLDKRLNHAVLSWERQKTDDPDIPSPEFFFMSANELMDELDKHTTIRNYSLKPHRSDVIEFNIAPSRQYQGNLDELRKDIRTFSGEKKSCHIACDNRGQAERLSELLDDVEGSFISDIARISGGFTDPSTGVVLLTDHEIFGRYRRRVRYRRFKEGVPIPDHRALKLGDHVVHVDYGIGKYMGLQRVKTGTIETDCLFIRYQGDDKLFLPVDQLKRLKKFSVEEGVVPVINKLSGTSWEKLKAKTKTSIQRMARDLLRLYAERKAFTGYAFTPDKHLITSLEESFIYEDTPDQMRAWRDVRNDMENSAPMERLICGDVGFGKTEIAIRAAFTAVLDKKQVAVLVPTTILAEQHLETFLERLADYPVIVDSISRFRSRGEQAKILERVTTGKIDIIIGTHRLLSKDVHFKDIGLLIIDEEQRFGVRHKERIKKMRRHIDVLAMTATPIPRTLNMSLLGARDISYINTPPPDRYSVHTEVVPFEEKTVIEAVLREIDRDGQVFFVHNRVRSLDSMASYLRSLMPSVSFCVVHGQLPDKELARRMHDFYHGKYQVLVTTMIIENGLDLPRVNTILMNRADTFGLAQIYQLRGRVGRSNTRAHAYLLVPPKIPLSKIARKRLQTIEELASLGSGFNIAMRDLEFRGAGNILGTEQSGFISAVGFDLYCDLLQETIAELKGEKVEKPPEVTVHSKHDAYFTEDYIPDTQERVLFYRRLSETVYSTEVAALEEEMIDRFGRPGVPVVNLIDSAYIRHYAARIGASEVTLTNGEVSIHISEGIDITRESVEKLIKKSPIKLHFSFDKGMVIRFIPPPNSRGQLAEAKNVLHALVH